MILWSCAKFLSVIFSTKFIWYPVLLEDFLNLNNRPLPLFPYTESTPWYFDVHFVFHCTYCLNSILDVISCNYTTAKQLGILTCRLVEVPIMRQRPDRIVGEPHLLYLMSQPIDLPVDQGEGCVG